MTLRPSALLATKLSPPEVGTWVIVRDSLVESIVGSSAKLVMVRAPAGFGKTTLMAQARMQLAGEPFSTAWLTLDSADNDPARFLAYLGRALDDLGSYDPGFTEGMADAPLGEVAVALMERVGALTFPVTIFLDEFEVIRSPGVSALVAQLIESLPAGGRLVIGSRTVPDLRLARLRARGQLLEIDEHDLRFSLDETMRFFNARTGVQTLESESVRTLHAKTEGWIAALWLASMALARHDRQREFIAAFSGTEDSLAEYLVEEVLAQQPASVRRLLLSTSILREISAPLCEALLPGVGTTEILRQLHDAGVFLIPIEGRQGHWRYHSLFSSFLCGQLQREMPAAVPQLHRAAGQWFMEQGRWVSAIEHFLAAGEMASAMGLLQREAMTLLMQGRLLLLVGWFDTISQAELRNYPLLQIAHLWATCFTRGPQAGLSLIQHSELERSDDPEIQAHVAGLRATMLALLDRPEEAHAVAMQSLHLLPTTSIFANAALVNVAANTSTILGQFPEARQLLSRARQSQGDAASAFHRMYSETNEGTIALLEGRLCEAKARFHLAVQTTQNSRLDAAQGNAWGGLLYAVTVYEGNDLRQAKRLLQVYLPLARDAWLSEHVILGYRLLSRIAFHEGEIDHAFQGLSELEYLGHARQLPRLAAAARLERARLLLLQGYPDASAQELRHAGAAELWRAIGTRHHLGHEWEDLEIGRLRWEVHAGDAPRAELAIANLVFQAQRAGRIQRAIRLQLLQALALARSGQEEQAQDVLAKVLEPACGEGAMRLVLDEGALAGRMVARARTRIDAGRVDPIFADYLQRLSKAFGALLVEEPAPAVSAQPPSTEETLTPKEVRLLQLLAEGYSNRALTEKLFISDSTVRTHLRNINVKLGANSRTQAVAVARRMGYIG